MLKAVLFDMDGVIIDSEPLHARAAIHALKNYGVSLTSAFCYSFIGSTAKHMLEVVKEKYKLRASIEELMDANQKAKDELVLTEGYPPIPYVRELMEALHREGYQIAIASSSPREDILKTAERLNLTPFLDKIVSGMQVAHPKPAPDIFLTAAKELSVLPSECLVIEDSFNGLSAAKAAGMTRVAFHNPNSGNQDLSAANYIIEGFEEVTPFLLCQISAHANHQPAVIAESSRLILRELSIDDVGKLHQILSEPDIARFSGEPARTAEELSLLYEAYIPGAYHFRGYGLWGVFLKSTGELIGRCGFENAMIQDVPSVELGYLISKKFQKQGYASEAINAAFSVCPRFGFTTIFAVIDTENTVSIHLAEKFEMKNAGTMIRSSHACFIYQLNINPFLCNRQ